MRTDNAADFDVEYEYEASVRSELVTDWPLDVPGGLIEGPAILAWYDSDETTGLADWLKQTLHGRPARTATVPAEVTLRFTGSEAADPPESTTPVPAAVSTVHPSVAPPGADGRRVTDGQRIVPTGPTRCSTSTAIRNWRRPCARSRPAGVQVSRRSSDASSSAEASANSSRPAGSASIRPAQPPASPTPCPAPTPWSPIPAPRRPCGSRCTTPGASPTPGT